MLEIFSIIGAFTLGRWLYRIWRMCMNKKIFWEYVKDLREGISKGWSRTYKQEQLDNIVRTVTGEKEMTKESLQEEVMRLIKRIQEAKENGKMKEKADELIEKLKKEL